jgi:hypothetical protein
VSTNKITSDILAEISRADDIHGPHPTLAHAIEVLREEFDEMVQEARRKDVDPVRIYTEGVHMAAMAFKLLRDCALPGRP